MAKAGKVGFTIEETLSGVLGPYTSFKWGLYLEGTCDLAKTKEFVEKHAPDMVKIGREVTNDIIASSGHDKPWKK